LSFTINNSLDKLLLQQFSEKEDENDDLQEMMKNNWCAGCG